MGFPVTTKSQGIGLGQVRRSQGREEEGSVSPLPLLPWRECVSQGGGRFGLGVVVTIVSGDLGVSVGMSKGSCGTDSCLKYAFRQKPLF